MRHGNGWVKIHRSLFAHKSIRNSSDIAFLTLIISWANYKESSIIINGEDSTLKRGQLATSERELATALKMTRPAIQRRLRWFANRSTLVVKPIQEGSIITILNYEQYQCAEIEPDPQAIHQPIHDRSISEEEKKQKGKKQDSKTLSSVVPTKAARATPPAEPLYPEDIATGAQWYAMALEETPWRQGKPDFTPERYAEGVAKLRRTMGMAPDGPSEILRFVRDDAFWRTNALSPAALLKKSKNGMKKVENIIVRMKTPAQRTDEGLMRWAREQAEINAAAAKGA